MRLTCDALASALTRVSRAFEKDGIRVVMDDISLEKLRGSVVEFKSSLMSSSFAVLSNPNAAMSCGCGSSFATK